MPTGKVQGKIAAILSERSIVINRGTSAGVKNGMKFAVGRTHEITDPDTHKVLGQVMTSQGSARVTEALPEMSICVLEPSFSGSTGAFAELFGEPKFPKVDISGRARDEMAIRVGDPVWELTEAVSPPKPSPPVGEKQ